MVRRAINNFAFEISANLPKRVYATNKTGFDYIDDTWSMASLDPKDYGPKKFPDISW